MRGPLRSIPRLSRRRLFRWLASVGSAALLAPLSSACQARVVEVERVVKVEKEVTKIVTEIVKQTVVVERTLTEPQATLVPTPGPASAQLSIQAIRSPWTLYLQRMTPAFEELFGVTAQWHPLGDWATYAKIVAAQHASGTLADLIEAPAGVLPLRWRVAGILQSMRVLGESGAVDTQGILAPALAAFEQGDDLLGLPYLVHGGDHLLGYDAQSLTSLQLPLPDVTWTLADLDTLNASLADTTAAGFDTPLVLPDALPLLHLFGVRLFDAQGCVAIEPDDLADLLSWVNRLRLMPANGPAADVLLSPAQGLLAGQRLAACVGLGHVRSWHWQAQQRSDSEPVLAATLFPRREDHTERAISINALGFCLSSAALTTDAAAQWLKYVSGREMGVQMFLQGLAAPGCRAASWTDERVLDVMPICGAIAQELDHAPPPDIPASLALVQCYQIWNRHIARLLDGALPATEIELMLAALQDTASASA